MIVFLLFSYFMLFFFLNDTATTEIYTLSLHDALPISLALRPTSWLSFNPATDEGGRTFSLNLASFSLEPSVQVIAASPRPRSTPPLPAHHWRVASSIDIFSAFSFR